MIFGYARVSTWGQDLESQIIALQKANCEKIYTEKFTGTKLERKEFQKLLKELAEGDTLVVTKLDRFARSTVQGLETVQNLFERGIKIHVLNMGIIENTPTGRLTFTIFSAFAEFERDMIVERTQEGKMLAKLNPKFKEGRPKKFNKAQLDLAMELLEHDTTKNVSRKTGISEATLYREKRQRKYHVS
ncbi:recombinase family protein [Melissococcus plutonius]|uniref:Site-specific recombinase, resolvase family n=1 Tax=Melissococcus plutonius TaxID=33970 RepID=A0A2Z5Y507_9ENTE|nr:recombinase family protein [Melissococcus plutonius]KMT26968.1 DNA-invertase [Melissococcus plutonius]KMT29101.1 DNA-invertase [Melissococcus plutonius]KMT33551.1 DNA-invertase [Melissococcus plutonius]KMT37794.1 DNA-invertase [Melissococcus plutonius]MCV2499635.1 recombinase family protein [Melissococcus plutonius]